MTAPAAQAPAASESRRFVLLALLALVVLGIGVNLPFWAYDTVEQDVYYTWIEGQRILQGENPYARALDSDMRTNQKYATYLPGFYLLGAAVQALGLREFEPWLRFWRPVFLLCNLAIAAFLLVACARRGWPWLGLWSGVFWLGNRWTLYTSRVAHIDFLALAPLLASLALWPTRRRAALLLCGVSLSIKQMAIILLPLYVLWDWRREDPGRWRRAAATLCLVALVPFVLSLPFLCWSFEGFCRSMLFSATRAPEGHVQGLHSLDTLIGMKVPSFAGLPARLPMLAVMALLWWATLRRELGRWTGCLLAFAAFLAFNSVLFMQYFAWPLALLPLALLESAGRATPGVGGGTAGGTNSGRS